MPPRDRICTTVPHNRLFIKYEPGTSCINRIPDAVCLSTYSTVGVYNFQIYIDFYRIFSTTVVYLHQLYEKLTTV